MNWCTGCNHEFCVCPWPEQSNLWCKTCFGDGWYVHYWIVCPSCNGSGHNRGEGLLLSDEHARLIELGRKFEEHQAIADEMVAEVTDEDVLALQAHFAEQRRLIALGEAVERIKARVEAPIRSNEDWWFSLGWPARLEQIYAEAERSRG